MTVTWEVLGRNTAVVDGVPLELSSRPRAVLLRLLIDAGRHVSSDQLTTFLWGDDRPRTHRNSISRFVADLRRALGEHGQRIVTVEGGYRIDVGPGELDVAEVRALLARAKTVAVADPEGAVDIVAVAEAVSHDEPNPWLATLVDTEPILQSHRDLRLAVLDTYGEIHLRVGRHVDLVMTLAVAAPLHPYVERVWHLYAEALQRSGRLADALRVCHEFRVALAGIGLVPSGAIRDLETRLLSGTAVTDEDLAEGLAVRPGGRQVDVVAIRRALEVNRFVSIVGMAGIGKSHLARVVALDDSIDGGVVHVLDIAAVRDASCLVPSFAVSVGIPAALDVATPSDLAVHLARMSCLIVLDGCDGFRAETTRMIETILESTERVRVLATSRRPFGSPDEHSHLLSTLSTQRPDGTTPSAAAAFLVECSGERDTAHFDIEEIEAVCVALHGHPDALRRVAALVEIKSLSSVRSVLEDRPATGPGDATNRVVDLLWDMLPLEAQTLLARTSVFGGSWSLAGAAAVCADGEDITASVGALVAVGLVGVDGDRFALDPVVRRFAGERLGDRSESDTVRTRLVDWVCSLTAPWGIPELGCIADANAVLVSEQANVVAALEFLRDRGQTEALAWLAVRASGMWINHGMHTEVAQWLGPVVGDERLSKSSRSAAAAALLEADLTIGRYGTLATWGQTVLELSGDEAHDWVPMVAGFLALLRLVVPMPMTSDEYLALAESRAERSDSVVVNRALVLARRAQLAHHDRRYDDAVALFREGLEIVTAQGRLLLALEMGETISLYNGGRRAEALASVDRWRSRSETDEWHYQIDLIGAIVRGGCGEPDLATQALAAAARRQQPISVWARADEFQMAFGLLADMRGERDLAESLLATPLSGSPFLTSMVVEHLVVSRDLDPEAGFRAVASELAARNEVRFTDRNVAGSTDDLVSWWVAGTRADGPGACAEPIVPVVTDSRPTFSGSSGG